MTTRIRQAAIGSMLLGLTLASVSTEAAMAVVDVRAISQLITQIRTLRDQLSVAQGQLTQAQNEYRAITGGRGMEQLLAGAPRNYLPADWAALGAYAQGSNVQTLMDASAILSAAQLAALSPSQREAIDGGRRSAATLQLMMREALATTSARFASIAELINAVPGAADQKGILDLQARIAAEQGMLQNEQTKLELLTQVAAAEETARRQQVKEQALAGVGTLRALPRMGL